MKHQMTREIIFGCLKKTLQNYTVMEHCGTKCVIHWNKKDDASDGLNNTTLLAMPWLSGMPKLSIFIGETISHCSFHLWKLQSLHANPFSLVMHILVQCWSSSPLPRPAQGITTGYEPKHTGISNISSSSQTCKSPSVCHESHSLHQKFQQTVIQQLRCWFKILSSCPILVTNLSFERILRTLTGIIIVMDVSRHHK